MHTAPRWRNGVFLRRHLSLVIFVGPALVYVLGTIGFPIVYACIASLYKIRGLAWTYVGFDNYVRVLGNKALWSASATSAQYVLTTVVLHMFIGLVCALAVNKVTFMRPLLRVVLLSPWVVAPSVSAVIWMWIFEPQFGVLNYVLSAAGLISEPIVWLGRPDTAFASIVLVDIWRGTPFIMILIIAALQAIPESQYEAAQIDGANSWQQFVYVTLPNIRPMLIVLSTLDAIDGLKQFDAIAVLTGGGPVDATRVVPVLIYQEAFKANRLGDATAIGILFMAFVAVLTIAYVLFLQRRTDQP